ncbi:MAG: hypothetical protein M3376_13100 [Actinomycetota bacterium]|nr:hypothetical protein [Actinomycetota bacterium]
MAEWYDEILALQLLENVDIWSGLQQHGFGPNSQLRLGFIYRAPGEVEARRLVAFLQEETDYDVQTHSRPDDDPREEPYWFVIGITQPTPLTRELLDDWVEWMIAAGAAEGPCAFDGCAAEFIAD